VRLTVIGCSGSFPRPDSPASCYLVEADGFAMLLDAGNGAIGMLQRHHAFLDIDAVCISHLHPDHCLDLCVYWIARTFAPHGKPPRIPVYGPAGIADHLAHAYGLDPDPGMRGTFDFQVLSPGTFNVGPFRVTTAHMNHPVETFGFRVEHEGRILTYSGDTAESAALVELARGADMFLCEASFLDQPDLPLAALHLTARQAVEHAIEADVGRLVLTHLLPWNDPARSLSEAKECGFRGDIELAQTGAVYDL
jgi:ribonuclease BN (tRNA processing enzyme)